MSSYKIKGWVVEMKYSVIIPVYNAEKTINRCVNSILKQSFFDFEIILVDDGSPDNCPQICDSLEKKDDRIKVIHKKNGGLPSARNAGLDAAKGDYVLFVDSDDYVEDNYFELYERYDIKNGLLVYTNRWIRNDKKEFCFRGIRNDLNDKSAFIKVKYLIESRTINTVCTKKFDRALIEKYNLRFNSKTVPAEDFIFGINYLLYCEDIKIFNESVYICDQTDSNSISRGKKENLINIYPYIFDCAYDLISRFEFSESEKNELYIIWDRLHVESFGTCVMEELKETEKSFFEIKKEIRNLCEIFYSKYKGGYGYSGVVHRVMRICIKYKLSGVLYVLGKLWVKMRG